MDDARDDAPLTDPRSLGRPDYPTWIMGHRGARAVAPENSIEGFSWAIANGLSSVEFDVRLTADGVLVCAHDETLEEHGGPTGLISNLDAGTIDEVVLTGGVRVPRLADVLDFAVGRLALNIEIKNDPREPSFDGNRSAAVALASLLEERSVAGTTDDIVAVSSFDALSAVRFVDGSTRFGNTAALLTHPGRNVQRILGEATELGVSAVHPHYSSLLPSNACRRLQDAGFAVRTWTVNSRLMAQRLRRSGVEMIVTDDPQRIV